MEALEDLLYKLFVIICFVVGVFVMMALFALSDRKTSLVVTDIAKKSAIELNVDASGGDRAITSSEVIASILAVTDDSCRVIVDGQEVTYNDILFARTRGLSIRNKVPSGMYVPSYSYDTDGKAKKMVFAKE